MGALKRIRADLLNFARSYTRSRVGLFFGLAFPVILIVLFGAIFSGGGSVPTVYAQNLDSAGANGVGSQFLTTLNATGSVQVVLVSTSQNLSSWLTSHSDSDGIVVPPAFSQDYAMGKPVDVTEYWNPASSTSQIVFGVVSGVLNAYNLHRANGSKVLGVQTQTIASRSYTYIDFLIPGMIGFAILISPMFAMTNISAQYKRDKIFKQLSLTPLTKRDWLVSKITFYTMMSGVSFVMMSAIGIYGFGAHITFTPWIIPFLVMGPFMFVSLGMLVGSVSTSVEAAGVVSNLITFPMMFLSGTFYPISIMPMYLQNIAHVFPLYYVIQGLNDVMIYGNYSGGSIDLAVSLVIASVFFLLAVRFFKWRED